MHMQTYRYFLAAVSNREAYGHVLLLVTMTTILTAHVTAIDHVCPHGAEVLKALDDSPASRPAAARFVVCVMDC